jgi:hypothetical protein
MRIYWRIKGLGAFFFEGDKALGKKPLFSINKWNKEIIVNMPYCQIILTPWSQLSNEMIGNLENGSDSGTATFKKSNRFAGFS